tara:strand:- start:10212 stop:11144 length:933 start_codon:yes stop_codon:yes gene_type:complete
MSWKPMLATNANLDKLVLPKLGSVKLEGVRGEFTPNGLFTRPLKRFNNGMLLSEKFIELILYCSENDIIVEGEFYKHGMPFNEISSICRRKGHQGVDKLEFHIFDIYISGMQTTRFDKRCVLMENIMKSISSKSIKLIPQIFHETKEEIVEHYERALTQGYEGWVLKDPDGVYKKGRSTVLEGTYLRLKPEDTFDGKVIEIIERFENLCDSEVNELGQLKKRQDKDMKASTGLAAVALVECKGFNKPIRVSLSRGILDYTDTKKSPSRASIFRNRASFIGRNIRFVGFTIKGMDLPRSPRFDDWRTDLDE